jgi:hypothetical protein
MTTHSVSLWSLDRLARCGLVASCGAVLGLVVVSQNASAQGKPAAQNQAPPAAAPALGGDADKRPPGQAGNCVVINNKTVALGINDEAQLICEADPRQGTVGDMLLSTRNDGLRAGCLCEGWGAANTTPASNFFTARANTAAGVVNVTRESFTSDGRQARSVTRIDPHKLRVTHVFRPSKETRFLYEIKVTLRNIGKQDIRDLRYTRTMDWDIEPTAFSEFVTLIANPARPRPVVYTDNNGFYDSDPLGARVPLDPAALNQDFIDLGPQDHGANFDLRFDRHKLKPGGSKSFEIYYGAAPTERQAQRAVSAVEAEACSFGQPNGGQRTGQPNTFIFSPSETAMTTMTMTAAACAPRIPAAAWVSTRTTTSGSSMNV